MESITIDLEPHYEILADLSIVPNEILQVIPKPLEHQIQTYQLQKKYDLILNTFPTGTGKTKATLLYLLDNRDVNTLFIAPTNELINQHREDVEEFVKAANLPHIVCEVNAHLLRGIDPDNNLFRQGERFYRLMKNPLEFAEQLGIPENKRNYRCPVIIITNPDLFYYAIYYCYNNLDRRNVFEAIFAFFQYIIIDEFHYYNAKQLANFLFFIAFSLEFGYFQDEKRKVCLLSATPDAQVYKYLERVASQGLKWKSIEPEFVKANHPRAVRTLAPIKLTFIGCSEPTDLLAQYTQEKADEIKLRLENLLDGALITNSLIDVNRTITNLRSIGLTADKDFGRITGAISSKERKSSAKKQLIIATPTVDIGYNFNKQAKNRQNIDFIIFTASYTDDFWQRLGRSGRVLGKKQENFISEAIALVSTETFLKIKDYVSGYSNQINREQLRDIILNSHAFPQKPFLHEYISSYAILESFRPLYELRKQMRHPERIEEVFELVRQLFAPNSKKSYRHYLYQLSRFNSLQASISSFKDSKKGDYTDMIIREFLNVANYWYTSNEDIDIDENTFSTFKKSLALGNNKSQEAIKKYVLEEFHALSSLFSFRDSFQSLNCAIYDPYHIITDNNNIIYYELFHLLKYYDLTWYKSVQDFQSGVINSSPLQPADLYCRVDRHRDKSENLIISFSLNTELNQEFFKRRYCNKPLAIQGFKMIASRLDGSIFPLSPKLTEAIQEKYITCLLVPEQGGSAGEIQGRTRDMQIRFPSILVTFSDSTTANYKGILGTNSYLVGSRIQKYLYALEKKTEFWIA
ncbi:type I-D CRISPR-associated helicase Cas3' [Anabaena sp. UHCC 0451]|uniref:type I-D CRISPR-associated helicase Cas3' n=1 Tax=Anabaena sp. UHCC 0451 TaxID=2055235 RepID=UPI002B215830|nr:type I-D CRISPR-associated helicase Cas3' [Anabaena sp. UHCC 0451]MEA5574897.1 type I-D CRISPR-associated helicase Cas3' [Anabaena sp. UHCC 0451]